MTDRSGVKVRMHLFACVESFYVEEGEAACQKIPESRIMFMPHGVELRGSLDCPCDARVWGP